MIFQPSSLLQHYQSYSNNPLFTGQHICIWNHLFQLINFTQKFRP